MIITKTPLRISFFGGGTDYPIWYRENSGAVLSTSINKYCFITCRYLPPFFEHKTRLIWSRIEMVKNVDEIVHPTAKEIIKFLGINDGLEIHYDADLPARSGLGSSSAFSVGLLHSLCALKGMTPTKKQLALDAIYIEQEKVGENVGSQDQVAAAFGGFNIIEFGGQNHIEINPITIGPEKLKYFEDHIVLFFTGLARNASEVAAEQVRLTPQKRSELERMHKMVYVAANLLKDGNLEDFGKLLHENWEIKKSLSPQISNSFIDEIYKAGRSTGALGGKLLGAGSGGFMLFFVKPENQAKVRARLNKLLYVPVKFEDKGSQIIFNGTQTYTS